MLAAAAALRRAPALLARVAARRAIISGSRVALAGLRAFSAGAATPDAESHDDFKPKLKAPPTDPAKLKELVDNVRHPGLDRQGRCRSLAPCHERTLPIDHRCDCLPPVRLSGNAARQEPQDRALYEGDAAAAHVRLQHARGAAAARTRCVYSRGSRSWRRGVCSAPPLGGLGACCAALPTSCLHSCTARPLPACACPIVHAGVDIHGVDILANATLRSYMKEYSDWPTFPQLYVDGACMPACVSPDCLPCPNCDSPCLPSSAGGACRCNSRRAGRLHACVAELSMAALVN